MATIQASATALGPKEKARIPPSLGRVKLTTITFDGLCVSNRKYGFVLLSQIFSPGPPTLMT